MLPNMYVHDLPLTVRSSSRVFTGIASRYDVLFRGERYREGYPTEELRAR